MVAADQDHPSDPRARRRRRRNALRRRPSVRLSSVRALAVEDQRDDPRGDPAPAVRRGHRGRELRHPVAAEHPVGSEAEERAAPAPGSRRAAWRPWCRHRRSTPCPGGTLPSATPRARAVWSIVQYCGQNPEMIMGSSRCSRIASMSALRRSSISSARSWRLSLLFAAISLGIAVPSAIDLRSAAISVMSLMRSGSSVRKKRGTGAAVGLGHRAVVQRRACGAVLRTEHEHGAVLPRRDPEDPVQATARSPASRSRYRRGCRAGTSSCRWCHSSPCTMCPASWSRLEPAVLVGDAVDVDVVDALRRDRVEPRVHAIPAPLRHERGGVRLVVRVREEQREDLVERSRSSRSGGLAELRQAPGSAPRRSARRSLNASIQSGSSSA